MENKIEIRGEKVENGITYMTLSQVVKDYATGRYNKTEDADFEVVLPSSICVGDEVSIVYTETGIKDIQVTQDADYEVVQPLLIENKNDKK